jgi:hypothetical protein
MNPPLSRTSRSAIAIATFTFTITTTLQAAPPSSPYPYSDDAQIVGTLKALPAGASMLLPTVRVEAGGNDKFSYPKFGPGQRDYSNKMPYAPDRGTALYGGGNHQVPHRMNDVWEFHLGSNTWHLIYGPDGGNPSPHKGAYFLTSRTLVRKPNTVLDEKQTKQIEAYRSWWNKHVALKDGHIATTNGGPVMPAHTWDAFTYDPKSSRLIWGMGANPAAQPATYAYYSDLTIEQVNAKLDARYTPMWMFDLKTRKWIHYRTQKLDTPRAALRGMGATMHYIPHLGKSIWYVAAQNVSPAAFEMWTFDAAKDQWEELKPNGGKSIGELAGKLKIAPMSEQQVAYSTKDRKLVAVLKHDTFVYDIDANIWAKVNTDESIYGHDAHSIFVYDQQADVFLLAFPPKGKGKALSLAAFSLKTMKWQPITPKGPAIPQTKYGGYMGYYDPAHNALVVQGRYVRQMWVYRHGQVVEP